MRSMAKPIGLERSTGSVTDAMKTPRRSATSHSRSKSLERRTSRSSFQTSTPSALLAAAPAISSSKSVHNPVPSPETPGQVRSKLLFDHAGTPTDPSDDEFLGFLGSVKESTDRTDDFCAAALPVLVG